MAPRNSAESADAQHRDLAPLPLMPLSQSALSDMRWTNDFRGMIVLDEAGYEIGPVADLVIDGSSHRVYFVVVRPSAPLFDGAEAIIPVEAIRRRDAERMWVNEDHEHVAAGPRYDAKLVSDAGYQAGVYGWYGLTPYWYAERVRSHDRAPR